MFNRNAFGRVSRSIGMQPKLGVAAIEVIKDSPKRHGFPALGMTRSMSDIEGVDIKVHPWRIVDKTL